MQTKPSGRGRYARRLVVPPPKREIAVMLPAELVSKLEVAATEYGFDTRSALIQRACEEMLEEMEEEE